MLFDIDAMRWDPELLSALEVPAAILPEVRTSSEIYGYVSGDLSSGQPIPIAGIAGDQQASLFGQACFEPGSAKNTYGTGCFVLTNTGKRRVESTAGLISTVAWALGGETIYALEGSIFSAGSTIQWLRDGLGLISDAAESEDLALQVPDNGGVYLVPAFYGLGAPYWDAYARGAVIGPVRWNEQGAHSQGRPGVHRLPDTRRSGSDAPRRRNRPKLAQGRRRRDRQRLPHAVPGGHSWDSRRTLGREGDHSPRRRLSRRHRSGVLGQPARHRRPLESRQALRTQDERRP